MRAPRTLRVSVYPQAKPAALFDGYLVEDGRRRKAKRDELREAHRLWWRHKDIREGRVPIDEVKLTRSIKGAA